MLLRGLHRPNQIGLQMREQQRAGDEPERLRVVILDEDRVDRVRKLERHLSHRDGVQHG
jgi:hypothetical protein